MANISVYSSVLNDGADISATNVEDNSSATYLADDRLSYKFVTDANDTKISADQSTDDTRDWRYVSFVDHNVSGATVTVSGYASQGRTSPQAVGGGTVSGDPWILDLGSDQSYQYLDILIGASAVMSIGEILVGPKFDSPVRPGVGIRTDYKPRSTTVMMPNGERQTVKHAEVVRQKAYVIPGLTIAEGEEWSDLFIRNEGSQLVILADDREDTYPCYMNEELRVDDFVTILSVTLDFTEVKLS